MTTLGQPILKLPRLHTRENLLQHMEAWLQARPELEELLGLQERLIGTDAAPGAAGRARSAQLMSSTMSTAGRNLLAGSLLEEEISPEEMLRRDMEAVKMERARLLEQLRLLRTDPGKAGGDLQQHDIAYLRSEVEIKKARLNELREEATRKEKQVGKLILDSQDCMRLMPDGSPEAQARLSELRGEHESLAQESAEAEAKHRLYTLLEARTKRELMDTANKVTHAQFLADMYKEDETALLLYVHSMRAALEDAQKEKQRATQHHEDTREDWAKKLKARHREVRDLQKREEEEQAREERRAQMLAEKEAAEKEKRAHLLLQEEAYALQLSAIQPKLEALEEAWSRLHTLTGANSQEQLIEYWKGLGVQEESLHELARLAETRQGECREVIASLLAQRSSLLEETPRTDPEAGDGGAKSKREEAEKLEEAARRAEAAKNQFNQLRDTCIGAQQGLYALYTRMEAALARLDPRYTMQDRRRSSEIGRALRNAGVARQSTLSRVNSLASRQTGLKNPAEPPSAPKLQRLYTIDQDAFFPDLPLLVQSTMERIQLLTEAARRVKYEEKVGQENSPPEKQASVAGTLQSEKLQLSPSKAGSKKGAPVKFDLSRLVGYNEDAATPVPPKDDEAEGSEWDGVVNRQIIKNRAAKIVQRQKAVTSPKAGKK